MRGRPLDEFERAIGALEVLRSELADLDDPWRVWVLRALADGAGLGDALGWANAVPPSLPVVVDMRGPAAPIVDTPAKEPPRAEKALSRVLAALEKCERAVNTETLVKATGLDEKLVSQVLKVAASRGFITDMNWNGAIRAGPPLWAFPEGKERPKLAKSSDVAPGNEKFDAMIDFVRTEGKATARSYAQHCKLTEGGARLRLAAGVTHGVLTRAMEKGVAYWTLKAEG